MTAPTLAALMCIAALSCGAIGCAKTQARTAPELPPLDVPAPPPRAVEPAVVSTPQPGPPLVEAPQPNTPGTLLSVAPAQRTEPAKPEPPKPATPVVEAPAGVEAQRAAPPATTLQTISPQKEGEVEASIRAQLTRAAADLNRVHYQALGDDRKINYEEAKVYLKQAEDALRDKNLLFARTVADKAERIAAQLSGRD
jgi:hypothetical protein